MLFSPSKERSKKSKKNLIFNSHNGCCNNKNLNNNKHNNKEKKEKKEKEEKKIYWKSLIFFKN